MKKNKILTPEQKRADFDIWIIVIITFSVFLFYGAFQKPLMAYVSDSFEPFQILTTFAAIYGMLIVRKLTGNAWGCIFAFCFIWNAI